MPKIPKRQSLPKQAAEVIQEMIQDGSLSGHLPGERTLASRLHIGRDTLRAALGILEKSGQISPKEHGKSREVLARKSGKGKAAEKVKRVAFVSPKQLSELPSWMLVEVDIMREQLNEQGYQLELISPGVFHLKNPAHRLQKLVVGAQFDAWILYQCTEPVQRWFQKEQVPTIIRGYPHADIDMPYIDEDWDAAAYHAGVTLARNGHRHVGLLMPNTKLAGLVAAESGLRRALENETVDGKVTRIVDQAEPGSVKRALEHTFLDKNAPTALVASRSRHVLTSISWLASHRIRVPQELSLVALCYEPWFEHLHPGVSHYHADPAGLAKTVARSVVGMLETTTGSPRRKLLIPDFNERGSIRDISGL